MSKGIFVLTLVQELTLKYVAMTAVKENSTIQENKQAAFKECPVTFVMEKIGGYWKPVILFHLLSGERRYHELKKAIAAITEKVLVQQLKQLEADGLIIRDVKEGKMPIVRYSLSASGLGLRPVLYAMAVWAIGESGVDPAMRYKSLDEFPGRV